MAQSTALHDAAVDFQVVRVFLERSCTIENAIKVLQQDKSALREECKGRGLAMKTMTAAIAIAKKRQLVPVSRDILDALISEGEEKRLAPEDARWTGGGQPEDCCVCTEGSAHGLRTHFLFAMPGRATAQRRTARIDAVCEACLCATCLCCPELRHVLA